MQPLIGGRVRAHSLRTCAKESLEAISHGGVAITTFWCLMSFRNACWASS